MNAALNYTALPPSLRGGMQRYIVDGIAPGSFLRAVLCNDLRAACAHADDFHRGQLFAIVNWLHNEAPALCWGTPERVTRWVEARRMERAS